MENYDNEYQFEIDNPHLIIEDYLGTVAYYDPENDVYYNLWGQKLRHLKEYNKTCEGYTPFGDEDY